MTDEEKEQPESVETQTRTPSVGARLSEARQAQGVDRQYVADQLHLRPTVIAAIEEGDYNEVPGELFLKGYVRTYARLVELPAEELLEQLELELEPFRREQEQQQEVSPTEAIRQRKEHRRRLGTVVIALVALALVAWLVYAFGPFVAEQTGDLVGEAGERIEEAVADGEADEAPTVADDLEVERSEAMSETDAAAEAPRLSEGPIAQVPVPDEPQQAEAGGVVAPEPEPVADQVELTMSFAGECWVEVVNGEGEQVVVRMAQEGDTIDYSGPGPLEILLGNVNAVADIAFMGEPVDLGDYPVRAGRTQFVLAANGT